MTSDPIGDLLTRIRNAAMRKHKQTIAPYSQMKESILRILKNEGYINDFEVVQEKDKNGKERSLKTLLITLAYNGNASAIREIHRISTPSVRRYRSYREIKPVLNGYGVGIITTPKGIITDKEARKMKLGGEIICEVW